MISTKVIFSFNAEAKGLYGESFAVGYTIENFDGKELEYGYFACPSENANGTDLSREWVQKNVVPTLKDLPITHHNPQEISEEIYKLWMRVKGQYNEVIAIADCGYPVETELLFKAFKVDPNRRYEGPYPLHEVATALLMAGINEKDYPRLQNELPEHNPVNYARYSARLFILAMNKVNPKMIC
jgi:hypothetical protein